MSLLRTLFIIAIIYLVIRFVSKFIFPLLVKKAMERAEQNLKTKMDDVYRSRNDGNVGDISVNQKPGGKNKRGTDDGEYVDYEEVK